MLTEEQLREIERTEQAAMPGPWSYQESYSSPTSKCWIQTLADLPQHFRAGVRFIGQIGDGDHLHWALDDARFVAGARTWVPQLLAMVRELQR